jgi:hypothetical protein
LLSFVDCATSPAATSLEALDADEFAESRSAWMVASEDADPAESVAGVLVGSVLVGTALVGAVTAAGCAVLPNREHPASEAPTRATAAAVTPIRAMRERESGDLT